MKPFNYSSAEKIVLPVLFIFLISASVFYVILTRKHQKLRGIPLKIITICLILTEILKQVYYLSTNQYQKNFIPLWFCSLFMVLFLLSEFTPSKVAKNFKPMSFCFSFVFMILLICYPSWMWGASASGIFDGVPHFVQFNYHALLLAYFIYSLISLSYVPRRRDCLLLIICVLFYISYAVPAAISLNVNYEWLLYSIYPPFDKFRINHGQFAYLCGYVTIICLVACSILMFYYAIYQLIMIAKEARSGKNKL